MERSRKMQKQETIRSEHGENRCLYSLYLHLPSPPLSPSVPSPRLAHPPSQPAHPQRRQVADRTGTLPLTNYTAVTMGTRWRPGFQRFLSVRLTITGSKNDNCALGHLTHVPRVWVGSSYLEHTRHSTPNALQIVDGFVSA